MAEARAFTLRSVALSAYGPTVLFSSATGGMLPLVALAARDAGASLGVAALVMTLYSVGSLVMTIPASLVIARFGERTALVGSGLLAAAGMSVTGLTSSLWALCLGLFAAGLGNSVFSIARQSFLTLVAPPEMRARALSTLGGVARVGMFTGPFLMAFFMEFTTLRGAFLLTAGLAAFAALLSATVPDEERLARRFGQSVQETTTAAAASVSIRDVWAQRRKTLLTIGAGMVLLSAVRQTKYSVVPLWASHIGMDAQGAAVVVGLSSAADMLLFYPAGRLMDLKGRWLMALACLGGMALSLGAMTLTAAPAGLTVTAVALGLSNGLGSGIAMTIAADVSIEPGRQQFLGLWRFLQEGGSLLGPSAFALVTDLLSLAAGLWWTALVAAAGAAVLVSFMPRRPGPVTPLEAR